MMYDLAVWIVSSKAVVLDSVVLIPGSVNTIR